MIPFRHSIASTSSSAILHPLPPLLSLSLFSSFHKFISSSSVSPPPLTSFHLPSHPLLQRHSSSFILSHSPSLFSLSPPFPSSVGRRWIHTENNSKNSNIDSDSGVDSAFHYSHSDPNIKQYEKHPKTPIPSSASLSPHSPPSPSLFDETFDILSYYYRTLRNLNDLSSIRIQGELSLSSSSSSPPSLPSSLSRLPLVGYDLLLLQKIILSHPSYRRMGITAPNITNPQDSNIPPPSPFEVIIHYVLVNGVRQCVLSVVNEKGEEFPISIKFIKEGIIMMEKKEKERINSQNISSTDTNSPLSPPLVPTIMEDNPPPSLSKKKSPTPISFFHHPHDNLSIISDPQSPSLTHPSFLPHNNHSLSSSSASSSLLSRDDKDDDHDIERAIEMLSSNTWSHRKSLHTKAVNLREENDNLRMFFSLEDEMKYFIDIKVPKVEIGRITTGSETHSAGISELSELLSQLSHYHTMEYREVMKQKTEVVEILQKVLSHPLSLSTLSLSSYEFLLLYCVIFHHSPSPTLFPPSYPPLFFHSLSTFHHLPYSWYKSHLRHSLSRIHHHLSEYHVGDEIQSELWNLPFDNHVVSFVDESMMNRSDTNETPISSSSNPSDRTYSLYFPFFATLDTFRMKKLSYWKTIKMKYSEGQTFHQFAMPLLISAMEILNIIIQNTITSSSSPSIPPLLQLDPPLIYDMAALLQRIDIIMHTFHISLPDANGEDSVKILMNKLMTYMRPLIEMAAVAPSMSVTMLRNMDRERKKERENIMINSGVSGTNDAPNDIMDNSIAVNHNHNSISPSSSSSLSTLLPFLSDNFSTFTPSFLDIYIHSQFLLLRHSSSHSESHSIQTNLFNFIVNIKNKNIQSLHHASYKLILFLHTEWMKTAGENLKFHHQSNSSHPVPLPYSFDDIDLSFQNFLSLYLSCGFRLSPIIYKMISDMSIHKYYYGYKGNSPSVYSVERVVEEGMKAADTLMKTIQIIEEEEFPIDKEEDEGNIPMKSYDVSSNNVNILYTLYEYSTYLLTSLASYVHSHLTPTIPSLSPLTHHSLLHTFTTLTQRLFSLPSPIILFILRTLQMRHHVFGEKDEWGNKGSYEECINYNERFRYYLEGMARTEAKRRNREKMKNKNNGKGSGNGNGKSETIEDDDHHDANNNRNDLDLDTIPSRGLIPLPESISTQPHWSPFYQDLPTHHVLFYSYIRAWIFNNLLFISRYTITIMNVSPSPPPSPYEVPTLPQIHHIFTSILSSLSHLITMDRTLTRISTQVLANLHAVILLCGTSDQVESITNIMDTVDSTRVMTLYRTDKREEMSHLPYIDTLCTPLYSPSYYHTLLATSCFSLPDSTPLVLSTLKQYEKRMESIVQHTMKQNEWIQHGGPEVAGLLKKHFDAKDILEPLNFAAQRMGQWEEKNKMEGKMKNNYTVDGGESDKDKRNMDEFQSAYHWILSELYSFFSTPSLITSNHQHSNLYYTPATFSQYLDLLISDQQYRQCEHLLNVMEKNGGVAITSKYFLRAKRMILDGELQREMEVLRKEKKKEKGNDPVDHHDIVSLDKAQRSAHGDLMFLYSSYETDVDTQFKDKLREDLQKKNDENSHGNLWLAALKRILQEAENRNQKREARMGGMGGEGRRAKMVPGEKDIEVVSKGRQEDQLTSLPSAISSSAPSSSSSSSSSSPLLHPIDTPSSTYIMSKDLVRTRYGKALTRAKGGGEGKKQDFSRILIRKSGKEGNTKVQGQGQTQRQTQAATSPSPSPSPSPIPSPLSRPSHPDHITVRFGPVSIVSSSAIKLIKRNKSYLPSASSSAPPSAETNTHTSASSFSSSPSSPLNRSFPSMFTSPTAKLSIVKIDTNIVQKVLKMRRKAQIKEIIKQETGQETGGRGGGGGGEKENETDKEKKDSKTDDSPPSSVTGVFPTQILFNGIDLLRLLRYDAISSLTTAQLKGIFSHPLLMNGNSMGKKGRKSKVFLVEIIEMWIRGGMQRREMEMEKEMEEERVEEIENSLNGGHRKLMGKTEAQEQDRKDPHEENEEDEDEDDEDYDEDEKEKQVGEDATALKI